MICRPNVSRTAFRARGAATEKALSPSRQRVGSNDDVATRRYMRCIDRQLTGVASTRYSNWNILLRTLIGLSVMFNHVL